MILPDFLVFDDKGLYCKYGNFYLDPQQPVNRAVISHAHGDHAISGNHTVFCTPATAAIMQLRYKKAAAKEFQTINFNQPFSINSVQIYFVSAGHILGSAQVLMEYKGVKYLYTGDYKLQADATCEQIEYVKADVLITESTFADPEVKHPDAAEEILKLNQTPHNILLGAYSLGKSQRLINLINTYCPQRIVLIHHAILPINKLYENFSYPPGIYQPYNRKLMKEPDRGYVYIVPPSTFDSYFRANNVVRVFASGWKRLHTNNNLDLYISDHADWEDILEMINLIEPKEIWTLHGDGNHLKNWYTGKIPIKILNHAKTG